MQKYTISRGFAAKVTNMGQVSTSIGVDADVEVLEEGTHLITADGRNKVPIQIRGDGGVVIRHPEIIGSKENVIVNFGDGLMRRGDELVGRATVIRLEEIGRNGLVVTVFGEPFGYQKIEAFAEVRLRGEKEEGH